MNLTIKTVTNEIETRFDYEKFPDKLINKIIPDISYQDIKLGKVTYFNALFLDQYYCTG